MTSNTQTNDNCILTDAELNGVSGGNFFDDKPLTNGDNPFVKTVEEVASFTYRQGKYGPHCTCS
jgi:hypothetical protein